MSEFPIPPVGGDASYIQHQMRWPKYRYETRTIYDYSDFNVGGRIVAAHWSERDNGWKVVVEYEVDDV